MAFPARQRVDRKEAARRPALRPSPALYTGHARLAARTRPQTTTPTGPVHGAQDSTAARLARARKPSTIRLERQELLAAAAAHPMAFALAIFLLAALVIGWPWLSGRVTIPWDAKAHFQPQIQFLAQSLARGESPAWAPFVFSGHPQIADPQAMIFSPPFLVLALLDGAPSLWAVDATVLAMVFLGGAALMLWFRDQGWHWAGGLIAALAFSYGASMAWRIQHIGQVLSLAYLPIAMVCLDRALARGSILYGIAAGLVAACMVLGRDQVALLGIYLLAGLAVWRLLSAAEPRVALRASALPLAAGGVCAALLIAVPVLLTALLAQESNRPSIDYIGAARGSLHPALLLTLVMPDVFGASGRMEDYWGPPSFAWPDTGIFLAQNMGELYIGAIPLLLLLTAAVRGQLWAPEIRFFTCAAGVALVYALGWYTPVFRVLYALLPGVDLYRRPADATFLIGALGAILAGYGAHRLLSEPRADIRPPDGDHRGRHPRAGVPAGGRPGAVARPRAAALAAARCGARFVCRRGRCADLGDAAPGDQPAAGRGRAGRRHHRRSRLQQRPLLLHRPAAGDVRRARARHPQRHHRHPEIQGGGRRHAPRPHRAGGARLPLAQRQPHALASRTRWATTRCGSRSTARRPARRTTWACPTSASSRRCSRPIARRWPTCWACASSPPARPSRPWIRA